MVASPYLEINRDKGCKEMLDRALFTGPPQALAIEYPTAGPGEDPEEERFEHPASVLAWGTNRKHSNVFNTTDGWEFDDYAAVCQHLLAQVCVFKLTDFSPSLN